MIDESVPVQTFVCQGEQAPESARRRASTATPSTTSARADRLRIRGRRRGRRRRATRALQQLGEAGRDEDRASQALHAVSRGEIERARYSKGVEDSLAVGVRATAAGERFGGRVVDAVVNRAHVVTAEGTDTGPEPAVAPDRKAADRLVARLASAVWLAEPRPAEALVGPVA